MGREQDGGVDAAVSPDATVEPACPPLAASPTTHEGDVVADEVWSAKDSPHLITYDVNVRDGAKLTIEPCAVVRFSEGTSLNVAFPLTPNTGTLVAEGSAERPIVFEGQGGARWDNILVHGPGTASLAYVTIRGGGGGDTQIGESVRALGDGELPSDPLLKVDHVTIEGSHGPGISLARGAKFTADSRELTLRDNGNEEYPFPIYLGELAIESLPTGSYTGNRVDEILIESQVVSGQDGVMEDTTIRDRGVPYRVGTTAGSDDLVIGAPPGVPPVVLTIEPGVTLKFLRNSGIEVDRFVATEKPATAVLGAVGTADKPIVFTSAADTPAAGDWRGLKYGGLPSGDNRLEHVRIEYAGADCSCSLVTCTRGVTDFEAAIILHDPPPAMFLRNSTIKDVAGHAVVQGWDGSGFDWGESNTFSGVTGCRETLPRDVDTTCPDPEPECVRFQ